MAQFQYTAVNAAGKKLGGLIAAENEDDARKQLGSLNISILAIQKTAETKLQTETKEPGTSEELPKYEFEAFDKNAKKVIGTIPASSRYKAFQRLIDEYGFEVSYVVQAGATPEDKEKAKHDDLSALKAEYLAQAKEKGENPQADANTNLAFEKKRAELLKKVDFILEKIKSILAEFSEEIKPENKKMIQDCVDKLLRIKSSTNLDYIEHTSEELLKKVQNQEIFLHKEKLVAEKSRIKLDTQKMMAELHTGSNDKKDITDNLEDLQKKLLDSKNKFLLGISNFIKKFLPTEQEKEIGRLIKNTNREIFIFVKIWLTSPKITKPEAFKSLKAVWDERKRLKEQLRALKTKEVVKEIDVGPNENEPLILEELNHFLGWLLSFYILAYFAGHYVLAKEWPSGNPLPENFNLLASSLLRYLLLSIFLWYSLFYVKLEYFRYKAGLNTFVLIVGIVLNATLIFNL
ncbi:hypothetical protein HY463_00155 [Candidatus Peregrinibacteria bacterium]|nr:hypothetical protein [Candidatus Peregrinibacteria bacterium]